MVNLNILAKKITLIEGKKKQISIAQVKETLKITLRELAKLEMPEIIDLLTRYK